MYKLLFMMKRKPGMSFEDFISYYENVHSRLVDIGAPKAKPYSASIFRPLNDAQGRFDVVVEIWFADKADRDSSPALQDPAGMRRIVEDEANLFAREPALRLDGVESGACGCVL
jgi:hypothetical protein